MRVSAGAFTRGILLRLEAAGYRYSDVPGSECGGHQAPVFDFNEDGELGYFDVTTRMVASAPVTFFPGFGMIPLCYFYPRALARYSSVRRRKHVPILVREIQRKRLHRL